MPPLKKPQPKPPILFKLWAEKCLFHNYESTKSKLTFSEPTKGTTLSQYLSFQEIFNHIVSDRNIKIIKKGWVYLCLQARRCNIEYHSSNNKHSGEKSTKCLPNDCDATSSLTLNTAFVCLAFQKLLARNPDHKAIFNAFVPYLWGKEGSFSLLECTHLLCRGTISLPPHHLNSSGPWE